MPVTGWLFGTNAPRGFRSSIVSLFQLFRGPDQDFESGGIVRQVRLLREMQTNRLDHGVLLDLVFTALEDVRQVVHITAIDVFSGDRVKAIALHQELVET